MLAAVAAAFVAMLGLVGYVIAQDREPEELPFLAGSGPVQEEYGVSLEDVAETPRRYYGTTVTVGGEVGRILHRRAFTLRTEDLTGQHAALVVIPDDVAPVEGTTARLRPGGRLWVTGTVRRFDPGVDEDLGVDLDPGLWDSLRSRPVIVAKLLQGEPPGRPSAGTASTASTDPSVTLAHLADDPAAYLGKRVVVAGMVSDVLGRQAAVLEDLDPVAYEKLLVLSPRPLPGTGESAGRLLGLQDSMVRVTGTVRRVDPARLAEQTGVRLDRDVLEDFAGAPAIVAEEVTRFVPLNRVADNPGVFAGTTVGIAGTIEQVIAPHTLVLGDPDPMQPADVLVISRTPVWQAGQNETHPFVFVGNEIHVTGTVRRGDLHAIERELGITLDDRVYARFAERPVIVATAISRR
jgi:hypothetical protein